MLSDVCLAPKPTDNRLGPHVAKGHNRKHASRPHANLLAAILDRAVITSPCTSDLVANIAGAQFSRQ